MLETTIDRTKGEAGPSLAINLESEKERANRKFQDKLGVISSDYQLECFHNAPKICTYTHLCNSL